jgi:dienelactone hydrolase
MLGIVTLLIALCAQTALLVCRIVKKDRLTRITHIAHIAAFSVFSLLMAAGVYWWGFRWAGLFLLLAAWAMLGASYFLRPKRQEKAYRPAHAVRAFVGGTVLLALCILPGMVFPQFVPVAPTGSFAVKSTAYTYVDSARIDPFAGSNENRRVTVQFWYPDTPDGADTYPLVVFSPGAFGYRDTNHSTFLDLASNGYVVCSIDHPYHAFVSRHADGSVTPVDMNYLNDAFKVTNDQYDVRKTYDITHEWLTLRTDDMNFVLKEILRSAKAENPEKVYSLIDPDEIGLFGHSLGGATAAAVGRARGDVDAVMVLDGTMFGEEAGFENGRAFNDRTPYPVPLLNLYSESHYADALSAGTDYGNLSAAASAPEAWNVVIRGAGHLNFTDLPLFSPLVARMLGTGSVDSRTCIETMNRIALDYFNYELKHSGTLNLQAEY